MGVSMVSTVAELVRADHGPLALESMPVTGLMRTASLTGPITDSAASATAFATGHKTTNRALGTYPDGSRHPTLAELAEAKGLATALLTTTDLTDASPAAFAARVANRKEHVEIFEQMVATDIDLLAGGLRSAAVRFDRPTTKPAADKPYPISDGLRTRAAAAGRLMLTDPADLPTTTDDRTRLLLAYPERSPLDDAFGPRTAATLAAALPMLASDPDGFFLFAEIEETDCAGHAMDTDRAVAGVLELDEALRVALDFQKDHPDTLILVTADHDTGGMTLDNRGDYDSPRAEVLWISGNHTASLVGVYAAGPGAEAFTGVYENADLFTRIRDALALPHKAD
jgi:alkaline phosphatase